MADKAYVEIATMKVQSAFNNAYKTSLPKAMKTTATKVISSSSTMTVTKPVEKDAKGFSLDATVTNLTQDAKSGALEAKISMVLSTWPEESMFGMLSGGGKAPRSSPKTIDKDVEDLVGDILEALITDKVAKAIQQKKA